MKCSFLVEHDGENQEVEIVESVEEDRARKGRNGNDVYVNASSLIVMCSVGWNERWLLTKTVL